MLFSFSITNLLFSICILMNVKMIFEPAERLHIPTKDLLSYIFDNPEYDQDEPVRARYCQLNATRLTQADL